MGEEVEVRVGVGGDGEGGLGLQAKLGLVVSLTLLAGQFPQPFRSLHGPPQGDRKEGGPVV